MLLQKEKILSRIHFPVAVHLYDSVDSTNNEAKRRLDTDGMHLYATTHQTAGRGRRGHDFYSPKDTGLYMTLSFPLSGDPADIQKVTCAAAVAVCEAISALSDRRPQIKWVNDIYIDGKKVAGILTELLCDKENQPAAVIVGIGLNLTTEHFPAEFANRAGSIGDIEPNDLCGTVADRLIHLFGSLADNSVIEKYKRLNLCIGHTVAFTKDGLEHIAKAVDITADGGLAVEENGKRTVLHSGEISVIVR